MKIVLLPLDERPCNLSYPSLMPLEDDIQIVSPPRTLLSLKKERCDLNALHNWLKEECKDASYLIVSMDTLLYGGIVPSRLHFDKSETLLERSNVLKEIKNNNPSIKIYANELIMRTPCYSYSDEEPHYFDECGRELWLYGVYLDKKEQNVITKEEEEQFELLDKSVNKDYLNDLITRRETNKALIKNTIKLYQEGVIDYLVIPQDDCHPYGFTSRDRKDIISYVKQINLEKELLMHPGADEVGLTLLSRVLNDYHSKSLKIYVYYASEKGKEAIPCFEDSKLVNTILSHIKASGLTYTDDYSESDLVLFVNNGDIFFEETMDIVEFNKNRDLTHFMDKMEEVVKDKKVLGIADNVFCNRGDALLFESLFKRELFERLSSYAGWNTSSNTLDTTLCGLVSYYYSRNDYKKNFLLFHRFVEDYFYMAIVRDEIIKKIDANPQWNIKINNLSNMKAPLEQFAKERLERLIYKYQLINLSDKTKVSINFIWNRTFEIELILE